MVFLAVVFFAVVFLVDVFFVVVFLVDVFFAVVFLAAVSLADTFLAAGVLELNRIFSASSLVIDFGSRSFGILALFGRARPRPPAGLMAGPLM